MKSRKLNKILNDPKYIIGDYGEHIGVGNSMVSELISVNKKSLKIKYALDTFHKGRESINNELLEFIWDKLQELIDSGEINDIINGQDEIKNPLPVFYFKDGEIIETVTDVYGWPNTTIDGKVMYNNTHFKTKGAAIKEAIGEVESTLKWGKEKVDDLNNKVLKGQKRISEHELWLKNLKDIEE